MIGYIFSNKRDPHVLSYSNLEDKSKDWEKRCEKTLQIKFFSKSTGLNVKHIIPMY